MNTNRRSFIASAAITTAAGLSSPLLFAQGKGGPRKIVVGQSVPLTGAADQIGTSYAAGAKLYFDAFNARKNGPGYTFEVKQLDDGYVPAKAAANAKKLLDEGAEVLFGFVGTGSCDAAAQVAAREGAIFFAPYAASDALHDAKRGAIFHVRPSMADEALKIVRHCATLGQSRIALFAEDDAMGRAGLASVTQALADQKLPPLVGSAFSPVNSDRVDDAVASLMKMQPHAVIQVSLFNSTATFIRKMRKAGFGGTFMDFSVVGIDPLYTALGKEISGVVISQVVPSPKSTAVPIVKEYLGALDATDQTPAYESLEGFIAAKALAEAARRAGRTIDKASLMRAMENMTDFDVGGFRINLRAGLHDNARAIDLVTITADGKVVR